MECIFGFLLLASVIGLLLNNQEKVPSNVPSEDYLTDEDWDYMLFHDEILLNDEYWEDDFC